MLTQVKFLYNNRDFTKMNFHQRKAIRQEIGMLFQGGALFDYLDVEQNVMFPLNMFTNPIGRREKRTCEFCPSACKP